MVGLARRRLGSDADLQVAELGRPLPFPDDAASLVLHYLEDWGRPLPSCGACSSPADGSSCPLTIHLPQTCGTARPATSPIISRPTTGSMSEPWTARPRCCVSGPGRCTQWLTPSPQPASGYRSSASQPPRRIPPASCSPTKSRTGGASCVLPVLRPARQLIARSATGHGARWRRRASGTENPQTSGCPGVGQSWTVASTVRLEPPVSRWLRSRGGTLSWPDDGCGIYQKPSGGVAHAGWLVLGEEVLVGVPSVTALLSEPVDLEVLGNDACDPGEDVQAAPRTGEAPPLVLINREC
jgi:hypothetical protein